MAKDRNSNREGKSEGDDFLDLDELEEEESQGGYKNKKSKREQSTSIEDDSNEIVYEDGYLIGESEEDKEEFKNYLNDLEHDSGFKDLQKHRDKYGTGYDTGENFRRDFYDDEYKKEKDFKEEEARYDRQVAKNYANNYKNKGRKDKVKDVEDRNLSLSDEVSKYGSQEALSELDLKKGKNTKTGNKKMDNSLDALRQAIDYDIDKAVENDKKQMIENGRRMGRQPSERDFMKIEQKHKQKKADGMRKQVTNGIKTARTKENRSKFKEFMGSWEVKLALGLIGTFGGVYGKAFVKGVNIFTVIWGLNFGVVFGLIMGIAVLIPVFLIMSVFVVVMTLTDLGDVEDDGLEEVKEGSEQTSSSVEVPAGYEGKFMFPVEKTLQSERGFTGKGGHKGQDISGSTSENIYPIYPGKVLISGKDKPQCGNGNCSTAYSPSEGLYFTADGNSVQVAHEIGGKYVISYYMHLHANSIQVSEGDMVGYGTPLAKLGNSGNSTGPHLHVEIYDDVEKGFFDNGRAHYKTSYSWYYTLENKIISPPPLWTCGGKSGVAVNSAGSTTTPKSCLDDAIKARNK